MKANFLGNVRDAADTAKPKAIASEADPVIAVAALRRI
jgi:hypothetical protein